MSHPILGIDHVFLLVAQLDDAAAAYRRLGFTLSPRGLHSVEKGTANYTIIFEHDYFELLGVVADTPANQHQRDMINRDGEGLRAIACRITDAVQARAALATYGIRATEVVEFSRPLPLPDGSEGIAAFAVSHFAPEDTPKSFMFMCQHKTPDMVWRPELKSHANGAKALHGVVATDPDPKALAARFARLYAQAEIGSVPGGYLVKTGAQSANILCLTPDAAAARYDDAAMAHTPPTAFSALQITVGNLSAAAEVLTHAGVPCHKSPQASSLWIAPEYACGTVLELIEA